MNAWKAAIPGYLLALSAGSGANAQMPDALTGASPAYSKNHTECYQTDATAGNGDFMTRWADEIGLTGQQKSDIQIITADYAPRFSDLAKLGRDSARQLLEMAPDDPAYIPTTQQASALAASSAAELVTLLAEMRGKLYSVITPNQRTKLNDLLQARRAAIEACKQAAAAG